jgi:valyl-tRNA synthetase
LRRPQCNLIPGGTLEVAAPGVDRAEEQNRLQAQLAKLDAEVARAEAKLANQSFVGKAPAAVVDKEREKLAAYRADRDELAARLAQLQQG